MKKIILSLLICASSASYADIPFVPNFIQRHPIISAGVARSIYVGSVGSVAYIVNQLAQKPQDAPQYLNEHPNRAEAIVSEVLSRIRKSSTPEEYQRFVGLAQTIGIRNIPPYNPINPQASIPGKNYTQNDPRALINELPVSVSPTSNIIYTPQGVPLDTSTEFPYDKPRTYEDYLTLKQHSTILTDNMGGKMPGYAAHHIVPATAAGAAMARRILFDHGIDFNDAVNGVFLPTASNNAATQGIIHNGRHPDLYVQKINQRILDAHNNGKMIGGDVEAKIQVLKELQNVRSILSNAPLNAKWENIL